MSVFLIILCILNIPIIFGGFVLISQDLQLFPSPVNTVEDTDKDLKNIVKNFFFILGAALLIILVIGGIGLFMDSGWLLIIYGVIMGSLGVVSIMLGEYFINHSQKIKKSVDTFLDDSFLDPNMTRFHQIESRFKCCGTYGPDFYETYGEDYIAPSCCEGGRHCSKKTAFQRGCSFVLRNSLQQNANNWGTCAIIFGALQVVVAGMGLYRAGLTFKIPSFSGFGGFGRGGATMQDCI